MPVKIRLQRKGKKRFAYYHIVIADSRAPRDGRTIQQLGVYDPNSNPATIELDFDRALSWLQKGAQPTDTCRAILSYKGVMYKNHLLNGVTKGALTEDQVEAKFQDWLKAKEGKIDAKIVRLEKAEKDDVSKRFKAEEKVKAERAEAIAKKNAAEALKAKEVVAEETSEEVVAESGEQVAE
ncbi:MAG TPA: 30S ribosomal protein S16 [Bacteroidales bacterium]|nr:MAG: 30S ribosomal protein S16 [Bacteroidetes bacterium GWF2_33_38]OFY86757.1 MAG: 30S ribosomal protein S16 [Bacteroidetes bacterium RIFOXYA2_FULL_33_7]HBF88318.1 30S ribosomal protein S16 [Bacteroidales bacterium]